ncbi:MAG: hypothetical protein K9J37_12830 [Saprospiraceae bacterium]|nr:hypothetical protein [Saprospiraceae bacterium]MCF8250792.1 hypothetical protein [Saprospiraceae bacterium]MCF8283016.1 hypothetical protein [Bacteroidales bacterium]MCF8440922.1 hypothetical protein [Saprospiraceae bacterium]
MNRGGAGRLRRCQKRRVAGHTPWRSTRRGRVAFDNDKSGAQRDVYHDAHRGALQGGAGRLRRCKGGTQRDVNNMKIAPINPYQLLSTLINQKITPPHV